MRGAFAAASPIQAQNAYTTLPHPSPTGAYLLGVMPPELEALLGLRLPLLRRDPHYFLPTADGSGRHLLFGANEASMRDQFLRFFSPADWAAHTRLQAELAKLREDVAPTWMAPPLSLEDTAERFVRPALRQVFVDLMRRPVSEYLARFGFASELLTAMYAVTDGQSGLAGEWDSPGTGANFAVHNMCRLPGSGGTWMVVAGGMGAVTQRLAHAAMAAGVRILTGAAVSSIDVAGSSAAGVTLASGESLSARAVVSATDPFKLRALVGSAHLGAPLNARLDAMYRPGSTLKINLALRGLPAFSCLPEDRGQHRSTTHLLPDEGAVLQTLKESFADAQAGRLPDFPAIEWRVHARACPAAAARAAPRSSSTPLPHAARALTYHFHSLLHAPVPCPPLRHVAGTFTRLWTPACGTRRATTTRRCLCSPCRTRWPAAPAGRTRRRDMSRTCCPYATALRLAPRRWWPTPSR